MRTIYLDRLLRLTLTRKGKAIAKHPLLRENAVEAIKAEAVDEPLWVAVKAEEDDDWYAAFDRYMASVSFDDIPEDWLEAFASQNETAEKAKGTNYPDSQGPFAGPHNSFPIRNQEDVIHAAERLHNAGGNQASIRARIVSIARAHGYKLPKTWQKAKKGFMDPEQFDELVSRLSEALKGTIAPEAAEVSEEVSHSETEETEKAKGMTHSHEHNHSTQRGYGYSHTHDHTHGGDMSDHETSESAHGHDHVSKADEMDPAVKADLDGMDAEIKTLKEQVAALEVEKAALVEQVQAKEAEVASKAEEAEKAQDELKEAEEAAKQPLTAPIPETAEKAAKPVKEMSFDDAFDALLHR